MNKIRLSICIPTYNFGLFIGKTLKSITDQPSDEIEVVVLDGGSTDNTEEIVLRFQQIFPRINYRRLDKKGGIDKDLFRTVALARGNYCWLMSSDDVIKAGAIQRVLDEIKLEHDIYLCNRTECDRNLSPIRDRHWLSEDIGDHVFKFSTQAGFIDYFNKSLSIGALFSYMSSIIVRRDKWNEIKYNEIFTGSNYAHVFMLFSILQKNATLKYIKDSLILSRGDNDSFSKEGLFKRRMLDIDGYLLLSSHLFPNEAVSNSFLAVMQREHAWYDFAALKRFSPDKATWNDLEQKLIKYRYSRAILLMVKITTSSPYLLSAARCLWRRGARIAARIGLLNQNKKN